MSKASAAVDPAEVLDLEDEEPLESVTPDPPTEAARPPMDPNWLIDLWLKLGVARAELHEIERGAHATSHQAGAAREKAMKQVGAAAAAYDKGRERQRKGA